MDEWRGSTEFARLFPESASAAAKRTATLSATTAQGSAAASESELAGVAAGDTARLVSEAEAAQFLRDPGTMLGKRFVCSPPEDDDNNDELQPEDRGRWEVVSFRVHMDEGIVDREYMVLTEDLPDDPLPMGEDQVRAMLRYSTFAV